MGQGIRHKQEKFTHTIVKNVLLKKGLEEDIHYWDLRYVISEMTVLKFFCVTYVRGWNMFVSFMLIL